FFARMVSATECDPAVAASHGPASERQPFGMSTILVTGGCGFIGSHVALHLREAGHKVVVMDNLVRRGSEKNIAVLERHGAAFFHGDVRNPEDLSNLPSGI